MELSKLLSSAINRCCLLLACVTFAVPPPAIGKTVSSSTTLKATRSLGHSPATGSSW